MQGTVKGQNFSGKVIENYGTSYIVELDYPIKIDGKVKEVLVVLSCDKDMIYKTEELEAS
jgi:hypothetical protein